MDSEQQQYDNVLSDGDSEYDDSDDSVEDPTFDVLEETRSSLSKLSIKKHKSKDMSARRNVSKAMEECIEGEQDVEKMVPELDEKDQKSYGTVQEIIEAGQIEKLKVEQCKVYLRKHGLRLTGSKDVLIQRIKEHTDIVDGRGEEKYPPSSFILNCKGDACTGDVVMFEQNVYEMFSIASRSATGPPCGTRIVAGRIVKESYGAKKQQHTFTVEVLWSKGEKPLPPLHPLLIKGRNLYRLKTLRQKWDDEAERQRILSEKHARGSVARSNREARVQEKEMRKMRKENRVNTDYKEKKTEATNKGRMPHYTLSTEHQNNRVHSKGKPMHSLPTYSVKTIDQPQVEVDKGQNDEKEYRNVIQENVFSRENWPEERPHQRQPLTNVNLNTNGFGNGVNSNPSKSPLRMPYSSTHMPMWRSSNNGGYANSNNSPLRMHNSNAQPLTNVNLNTNGFGNGVNSNPSKSPLRMPYSSTHMPMWRSSNNGGYANSNNSPLRMHNSNAQPLTNVNLNTNGFGNGVNSNPSKSPLRMPYSSTHMPMWGSSNNGGYANSNNSPLSMHNSNAHVPMWRGYHDGGYNNCNTSRSPLRGHGHTYTNSHSQNMNYRSPQRTKHWQARNGWCNAGAVECLFQGQHEEQKRPCRFYAQGRCYYGHNCRYLHDSVDI